MGVEYDWTPLSIAARFNYIDIVSVLLDRGAYMEARAKSGNTPLHWAAGWKNPHQAECDQVNIISELLSRGANLNAENNAGDLPLNLAIQNHHPLAIRRLENNCDTADPCGC